MIDNYKEIYDCGKKFIYNDENYVFDGVTKQCIGMRIFDKHIQKYFIKKFD